TRQGLFFQRFLGFSIVQTVGLSLYSILVFIFTEKFKIYYLISIILSSALVYLSNFLLSRFYVFKS
ncbi:MAG: hypothetical protein QXR88_01445, partial [Candidatus Pacearchaeota archaeon]